MNYIEEKLKTPIWGEYDAVIVGGGVAGVSAAVAMKRFGVKRVLLLEKTVMLGGQATQGLISFYEPICDGFGHKLTYGMGSELMQLCRKYGPDDLPEIWQEDPDEVPGADARYKTFYSPAIFTLALDELVQDHEVDILFDTRVVMPLMEGGRCLGLIAENSDGRGAFKAAAVIDTTGDASMFSRAGAECVIGGNYLTCIGYRMDMESLPKALQQHNMLKGRIWYKAGSGPRGELHPPGAPLLEVVSAKDITRFMLDGRRLMLDKIRHDERMTRDITCLPSIPQVRTSRRIEGAYTLQEADACRTMHDSVGVVADFTQIDKGLWFEVPYRSLYVRTLRNMWTAGRCIAAAGWAWSSVRIIPGAAMTGEAAGYAAALCLKHQCAADDLPFEYLAKTLTAAGGRLHAPAEAGRASQKEDR